MGFCSEVCRSSFAVKVRVLSESTYALASRMLSQTSWIGLSPQ